MWQCPGYIAVMLSGSTFLYRLGRNCISVMRRINNAECLAEIEKCCQGITFQLGIYLIYCHYLEPYCALKCPGWKAFTVFRQAPHWDLVNFQQKKVLLISPHSSWVVKFHSVWRCFISGVCDKGTQRPNRRSSSGRILIARFPQT